jgi:cyclophilin family peptidyl-prolyl cis-trans isomerase
MFIGKLCNLATLARATFGALALTALLASPVIAEAETVLIATPLGDIEIELLKDDAPRTVANFLSYIDSGKYTKSFIHRSAKKQDNSGFVIQGGGFTFEDSAVAGIIPFDNVENEFKVSNTRGTVAMAKIGGQPDSANSQWFINLSDNAAILDDQNGGFTVFARVIGDGMAVADAISQLQIVNAGGVFTELPLIDYQPGQPATEANLVMTTVSRNEAVPNPEPFVMNAGLNDAWFNPATDGQGFFITVFPDLNYVSLAWFTYDTDLPTEDESANLGSPGHRWLTALGPIQGDTAVLNIDIATGGLFDTATEVQHTTPPGSDGTITLSFANCNSGLVEYDIPSIEQTGSVPIERVAGDNIGLCEALSGE